MRIGIARGAEAFSLLEEDAFHADWSRLRADCPWATAFQGPGFASTWYKVYRSRYEPLLILSRAADGRLNGLLPLAVSLANGEVVVAGAQQAEYQVWLCVPDLANEFAPGALRALRREVPSATLTFRFLPPRTPLGWLETSGLSRTCRLRAHRRPLLRFGDGAEIAESLKKKSNKSRLNRLEKIGPVRFERITDRTEFERTLGDIIPCYDLRHAALHGSGPFLEDDLKKAFHLAMLDVPNLLHATVLRAGDRFAAAHVGVCSDDEVQLGIITHSPFLARHSPGKFHVFYLAQMLMREGYSRLDLTPGGDAYKDRFSNDADEVHSLTVFSSPGGRRRAELRERIECEGKKVLQAFHVEPQQVRSFARKLAKVHPVRTPASVVRHARRWIGQRREMRVYFCEPARVSDTEEASSLIRRDALEDLLAYWPAEAWQSREHFLSGALARIEEGHHFYTCAENSRLLHYGWLIERQTTAFISEVHQEHTFPQNSACLYDFYTFPQARGRGLYTVSLRMALRDAARISGTDRVYATVLADNGASRHVIEKVGFTYECSLFEDVRLGRARRWGTRPATGPEETRVSNPDDGRQR